MLRTISLMRLRAWWWVRRQRGRIPRDVREYIIRRDLKPTIESLKGKPLEERQKVVGSLLEGALLLPPDEISTELRNELIKTAFEQVDWEPEPIPPAPSYASVHCAIAARLTQ